MKPPTLIASMLIAGTVAGVAPQIPTFVKSAFAPQTLAQKGASGQSDGAGVQVGWPTSTKPLFLRGSSGSYFAYVQMQNTSIDPQCVSMNARVQGADGAELSASIDPREPLQIAGLDTAVRKITLSLTRSDNSSIKHQQVTAGGPGTGYIRFWIAKATIDSGNINKPCPTKGDSHFDQEIRIPQEPLMGKIFLGSLITVIIVVVVTMINLIRAHIGLLHVMGVANWSFEKSWGANVTLGGALLMTLIGLTIFPEHPQLMAKGSYTLLQILFGALVALGPLVYNLIHRDVQVNNNGIQRIDSQGYVVLFLIAGGLVLWAALGQIATLAILTEEFVRGDALDRSTGCTLESLAVLLYGLLLVYGFRSLYRTAKRVSATPAVAGSVMPAPRPADVTALPLPISEWSIL